MRFLRYIVVLLWCFFCLMNVGWTQTDTTQQLVVSPQWFVEMVKAYHPQSFQAGLITEAARQKLREARGKFDPELYSEYDQKMFDDKNYFSIHESGVKVPTLGGVQVKASFKQNEGIFLNPENNVPEQGQGVIGVSLPLLQGLLTDERRTRLRQAKANQDMADAEQILALNSLLYNAYSAYWEWTGGYYQLRAVEEFEKATRIRFEAIRNNFFQGDKAAIDTTESLIQWQEAQRMLQESRAEYQKYYFDLRNFLWDERGSPITLPAEAIEPINFPDFPLAQIFSEDSLVIWMETQQFAHPKLRKGRAKQSILEAEKRLKAEKLKPMVNVEYNLLAEGTNFGNNNSHNNGGTYQQNYVFGVDAKFPIFLREARGAFQQAKIKIQDNELELWQAQQEVRNKVQAYFQQTRLLRSQVEQYAETVGLYQRMVEAERIKFDNGESSLFLVNSRELKWIEAQQKYLKSKVKYFKTLAAFYESMGLLHLQ